MWPNFKGDFLNIGKSMSNIGSVFKAVSSRPINNTIPY